MAHDAVAGFAARVTQPGAAAAAALPDTASAARMSHDLGRLLAMEGRSINALQAALRIGARVTWQSLQEQARQGNGNPEAFARIGKTVFWYMDELAASYSAGYAETRAELVGETSQLRRHLLDMLTSSPTPPALAIASLAQAVGWPLPRRVAAVALTPLAGMLSQDALAPLRRLRAGQEDRLAGTLLAWLESADDADDARRLHVHPQTIRYRLRQVSELFGDALTDPDARFRLLLALRVRRLLGSA